MLYYDRIDIRKRIDLNKSNVNISDIAIMTIKNVDYCCIIHNISKSEAINLLKKLCSRRSWIDIKILS